jgi:hypothetical protein
VDHCAIDLGGRKSQVCVRSPDGRLLFEGPYDTRSLPEFLQLLPRSRVMIIVKAK